MTAFFANLQAPRLDMPRALTLVALFFTLFYNRAFFRNCAEIYLNSDGGLWFMLSLGLFLFGLTLLVLSLLCFRWTIKPVLIVLFLSAAATSSYMNHYNVVIDTTMITNILQTDTREVRDLLSVSLLMELLLLGLLPAGLLCYCRIERVPLHQAILQRAKLLGLALLSLVLAIAPFSASYTSFFREHKILRYYTNPATPIYSSVKYLSMLTEEATPKVRSALGRDARIPEEDISRELVILVVGEAARADHFSLNGYERPTNPLLAQEDIINYPQASSCGTATAYSVPCMFSRMNRADFDLDQAQSQENLLDVLSHAGVNVLWRDNNSDSKGVSTRIPFEDFRSSDTNPVCDEECRDIGMLHGLPDYIAAHPDGDIVIVLHQMGNHGPAYFRRYPEAFEKFTPVCRTNQLEQCSDEEISNAYDNAILYTDWFLSQVIDFLKHYDDRFETAMYYMADHGESLGENGLYLHGLPYRLAPQAQKHVGSLMWLGSNYRADRTAMRQQARQEVSHDNYFHTVLGLLEIESSVYLPDQDLVRRAQNGNNR